MSTLTKFFLVKKKKWLVASVRNSVPSFLELMLIQHHSLTHFSIILDFFLCNHVLWVPDMKSSIFRSLLEFVNHFLVMNLCWFNATFIYRVFQGPSSSRQHPQKAPWPGLKKTMRQKVCRCRPVQRHVWTCPCPVFTPPAGLCSDSFYLLKFCTLGVWRLGSAVVSVIFAVHSGSLDWV